MDLKNLSFALLSYVHIYIYVYDIDTVWDFALKYIIYFLKYYICINIF